MHTAVFTAMACLALFFTGSVRGQAFTFAECETRGKSYRETVECEKELFKGFGDFCWAEHYSRGVARAPEYCASGQLIAGRCYATCPAGTETGLRSETGVRCWEPCPAGFTANKTRCLPDRKLSAYTAPSKAREHRPPRPRKDCRGWEYIGGLCYEPCASGYAADGVRCRENCRNDYETSGTRCVPTERSFIRKSFPRDSTAVACAPDQEVAGGLCYDHCPEGWYGAGTGCWSHCPDSEPVSCGPAACSSDKTTCEDTILNMVLAVADVIETAATIPGAIKGIAVKSAKKAAGKVAKKTPGKLLTKVDEAGDAALDRFRAELRKRFPDDPRKQADELAGYLQGRKPRPDIAAQTKQQVWDKYWKQAGEAGILEATVGDAFEDAYWLLDEMERDIEKQHGKEIAKQVIEGIDLSGVTGLVLAFLYPKCNLLTQSTADFEEQFVDQEGQSFTGPDGQQVIIPAAASRPTGAALDEFEREACSLPLAQHSDRVGYCLYGDGKSCVDVTVWAYEERGRLYGVYGRQPIPPGGTFMTNTGGRGAKKWCPTRVAVKRGKTRQQLSEGRFAWYYEGDKHRTSWKWVDDATAATTPAVTATQPGPPSTAVSTDLSGDYYILNTSGGPNHAFHGGYLSWDSDGARKADATVEKDDPVAWKFTKVGTDTYRITNTWGGPNHPLYGGYLSWDGGATSGNATVEMDDPVAWKVVAVAGKPGHFKILNTYGGASHPYFNFALSWKERSGSHPSATIERNANVVWRISRDKQPSPQAVVLPQPPRPEPLSPTPAAGSSQWVDAALHVNGKTWLFQGSRYFRLTGTTVDPGYPKQLPGEWRGLPLSFQQGIDAALFFKDNQRTYLFRGSQYVRLTGMSVDPGYPMSLPGGWRGLPSDFARGIDAAIFRAGHVYFFRGNRYVRFTGTQIDSGYPATLPGGWDLPQGFQADLGAAVYYRPNGRNYLFSGNRYVRLMDTKLDSGYPASLPGGWRGLFGP